MIKEQTLVKTEVKVYNPHIQSKPHSDIDCFGIEITDEYTRIDFVAYPDTITYISGWWVQIDKNTFIRPTGTTQKLTLIKAVNISIAPQKSMFPSSKSCIAYTLYFPSIPKNTSHIDIIEKEVRGGNYFNFYGVSLAKTKTPIYVPIN